MVRLAFHNLEGRAVNDVIVAIFFGRFAELILGAHVFMWS